MIRSGVMAVRKPNWRLRLLIYTVGG